MNVDEIRDKMTRDLSRRVHEVMMYGTEIDEDTVFVDYKTMGIRDKKDAELIDEVLYEMYDVLIELG